MKRDIVICCEAMLHSIAVGFSTPEILKGLAAERREQTFLTPLVFCPWCGRRLPFPHKEAK